MASTLVRGKSFEFGAPFHDRRPIGLGEFGAAAARLLPRLLAKTIPYPPLRLRIGSETTQADVEAVPDVAGRTGLRRPHPRQRRSFGWALFPRSASPNPSAF